MFLIFFFIYSLQINVSGDDDGHHVWFMKNHNFKS